MENKIKNTFGNRKLIAMILTLGLVMVAGYTMTPAALGSVIWGIVSTLGIFLTGNLIRKTIGRSRYGDEEGYD